MTGTARDLVRDAVAAGVLAASDALGWGDPARAAAVEIERPAEKAHGDYASNIAMRLAKPLRRPPLEIAKAIAERVPKRDAIAAVEAAPPGFINVRLDPAWLAQHVDAIVQAREAFGRTDALNGQKIQVEFISANPTGPMTIANARGGPIGDVLANVLAFHGATVTREYYVEDGGTQLKRFGISVAVRYRQLFGEDIDVPGDGYQGDYVKDIAVDIRDRYGDRFRELPIEEQAMVMAPIAIDWIVADAQRVTAKLGIQYDNWFKQSSLKESGYLTSTIEALRDRGVIVDRDGAIFFETPEAIALRREGDEGWVLVDAEGDAKYLATDIAYHRLCLEDRGFDLKLNVWGANTQYHLLQMKLALPVLGIDPSRFKVLLYQYVRFVHEGVLTRMGKRTGKFLLLDDVIEAVSKDVARWFFLMASADRTLDFDLELAIQQSNENPAYYVQYAHARIESIFRTAADRGLTVDGADISLLRDDAELDLVRLMLRFPELVEEIREKHNVHLLTGYGLELAGAFHAFYKGNRVIGEDQAKSKARLRLVEAVRVTLRQTLGLLGVSAPESM
jgi:arginyl-tRNA synthetase